MITVLIPAHDEGSKGRGDPQIVETLESLANQTVQPGAVVVIADNCTDDTAALATRAGARVFTTADNHAKKAGALNQWLDRHLPEAGPDDLIMVMDADSSLDPHFLHHALRYVDEGYDAVGGVFLGKEGGGAVGMFQRNEYARYARDVARKRGKTLVLTGTATIFTAECLREVVAGRASGRIPGTGEVSHVYDTKALTEDNELTFALLHLGYKIIAPAECGLTTEVMETWRDLWRQRYRWKRGAIENNWHYGVTRHTAKYWGLQVWGTIGIFATALYLATLGYATATGNLNLRLIWIIVTVVYVFERAITVRRRGPLQTTLAALLVVEMVYDICLQACHAYALATSMLKTRKDW